MDVATSANGPEPKKLEINGKSAVRRRPDMTAAGLDSRC
jgi:hypothetical protein